MERRTATRVSAGSPESLSYKAEVFRRDLGGHVSTYYNGGEFSPYCVESLVELLRGEAHTPYQSLELVFEFRGKCNASTVREVAKRFAAVHAPRLQVKICATGQHPVVFSVGEPSFNESASSPTARSGNSY